MRFPVVFFVIKIKKKFIQYNIIYFLSIIFINRSLSKPSQHINIYIMKKLKKLITLKLMIIIIKIKEKNIMMRLKYSEFKYE